MKVSISSIGSFWRRWGMLICLLALSPILSLVPFNHPSADDYCYSADSLEWGYLEAQKVLYQSLNGRYTATAILTANPLVFNKPHLYPYLSVLWIAGLFLSLNGLIKEVLIAQARQTAFLSLFILTVYLLFMPDLTEGIFWMAGAVTYQLSIILLVLTYTMVLRYYRIDAATKTFYGFIACVTTFLLMGLNETAMAFHFCLLLLILVVKAYHLQKIDLFIFLLWVVAACGAGVVIFSPGSAHRASLFPNNQSVWALVEAFLYAGFLFWKWLILTPLLALTYFNPLNAFSLKFRSLWPSEWNTPLLLWLTLMGSVYLTTFVGFYSLSFRPPSRTLNVIFFIFLLGWLYLYYQAPIKFSPTLLGIKHQRFLIGSFWILGLLGIPYGNNAIRATKEMGSGTIYRYHQEVTQRLQTLQLDISSSVPLPSLQYSPNLLRNYELAEDSEIWINDCYARYFRKESIYISN